MWSVACFVFQLLSSLSQRTWVTSHKAEIQTRKNQVVFWLFNMTVIKNKMTSKEIWLTFTWNLTDISTTSCFSDELREAMGLLPNQLPPYIYRMRLFGYPPGWLIEANRKASSLAMYDKDGRGMSQRDVLDIKLRISIWIGVTTLPLADLREVTLQFVYFLLVVFGAHCVGQCFFFIASLLYRIIWLLIFSLQLLYFPLTASLFCIRFSSEDHTVFCFKNNSNNEDIHMQHLSTKFCS